MDKTEIKFIINKLKLKYNALTNKELAKKLGIKEGTVRNWVVYKNIPKKYIELLNDGKSIFDFENYSNLENELLENFRKLNDKEKEYILYLTKLKVLEKEINN